MNFAEDYDYEVENINTHKYLPTEQDRVVSRSEVLRKITEKYDKRERQTSYSSHEFVGEVTIQKGGHPKEYTNTRRQNKHP